MKTHTNIYRILALSIAFMVGLPPAPAQTYTWTTIAGLGGVAGTSDGIGSAARFSQPVGIAVDNGGNAYVADFGNRMIRKLASNPSNSNWAVTTVANRNLEYGEFSPAAIVAATPLLLYVVDHNLTFNYGQLRPMTLVNGVWQTATPYVAGVAEHADPFLKPTGIAINGAGELFVTGAGCHALHLLGQQSLNSWGNAVISGSDSNPGAADGTNQAVRLRSPSGAGVDAAGNIFVADAGNHTIRKVSRMSGTNNWATTTIAGLAGNAGNADGTNENARFNTPDGIAFDPSGTIYISDQSNNAIRKITPQGTNWVVTTIGGQLNRSYGTNDGVSTAASFYQPAGLTVDNLGRVFVADYLNNTIRMGTPSAVTNPPPALQIASAGGTAFVIWPAPATGYALQTTTNAATGPWVTLTGGIRASFVFTGPMTNAQSFYRLLSQ